MSEPEKDVILPLIEENAVLSSPQPVKKSSWVNVVRNKPSLSQNKVEVDIVDGSAMVAIPDDVILNSVPLCEAFFEGRFLSSAPHVAKIHVIVNKIWPLWNKYIRIDVLLLTKQWLNSESRIRIHVK